MDRRGWQTTVHGVIKSWTRLKVTHTLADSLVAQRIKTACSTGDLGSIPRLGRSPGEGNGNPLQYSCLENPMDSGARWVKVHGVAKSQTWLSDFHFHNVKLTVGSGCLPGTLFKLPVHLRGSEWVVLVNEPWAKDMCHFCTEALKCLAFCLHGVPYFFCSDIGNNVLKMGTTKWKETGFLKIWRDKNLPNLANSYLIWMWVENNLSL